MNKTGPMRDCIIAVVFALFLAFPADNAFAWSEHPLFSFPVLASVAKVRDAAPVRVETIDTFVKTEGNKIERFLREEEAWARSNVPSYPPLPEPLSFRGEGDPTNTGHRFYNAIRVNPKAGFPLYLQHVPGQKTIGRATLKAQDITFLRDTADWRDTVFTALKAGEGVSPLEVVVSATDEPDLLGLDIGLFEDNGTAIGKVYGFGRQPFGNPHLEYGTQAPFHMGFYHEAKIMYVLAGFLKRTYPEYRIHLYGGLADLAFRTGHPYWGWRFLGWGLHYLADLTQPYHSTVLPGVSTVKALWINTQDMIGFHQAKADAIQLVSNRHTALEKYEQLVLRKAYEENNSNNPILTVLRRTNKAAAYDPTVPRRVVAKLSHELAAQTDELVGQTIPHKLVSDPSFELGGSSEKEQILKKVLAEKGQAGADKLNLLIGNLLAPFATYGPGYVDGIVR